MNEDGDKNGQLKDKVIQRIRSGGVSMRPKFFFSMKLLAIIVVAAAAMITTVFILNFIFFSVRINSQDVLLRFGPRGFVLFLRFFPWGLLLLDLVLLLVLEALLRQFPFGYKTPVLHLLGGLLVVSIVAAMFLDRGGLNERLFEGARGRHLPPFFAEFYNGAEHLPPTGSGICRCTITSIDGNQLGVLDNRSAKGTTTPMTVILPLDDWRATTTGLKVGDTVLIAGDEDDGVIRAFGVRKIDPNKRTMLFIKRFQPSR